MAADVDLVSSQGPQSTPTLEVRWRTCLLNTDLYTQGPSNCGQTSASSRLLSFHSAQCNSKLVKRPHMSHRPLFSFCNCKQDPQRIISKQKLGFRNISKGNLLKQKYEQKSGCNAMLPDCLCFITDNESIIGKFLLSLGLSLSSTSYF